MCCLDFPDARYAFFNPAGHIVSTSVRMAIRDLVHSRPTQDLYEMTKSKGVARITTKEGHPHGLVGALLRGTVKILVGDDVMGVAVDRAGCYIPFTAEHLKYGVAETPLVSIFYKEDGARRLRCFQSESLDVESPFFLQCLFTAGQRHPLPPGLIRALAD